MIGKKKNPLQKKTKKDYSQLLVTIYCKKQKTEELVKKEFWKGKEEENKKDLKSYNDQVMK